MVCFKVQVEPENVAFINWIMEGYEYLGVLTIINGKEGILQISSTEDMVEDAKKVFNNFAFAVKYLQ